VSGTRRKPGAYYYACCVAAIVMAGVCFHGLRYWLYGRGKGPVRALAIGLEQFSQRMGPWHTVSVGLEEDIEDVIASEVQDSWTAAYSDGRGLVMSLFIGYYRDMAIGSSHRPEICYPAGGWTLVRTERIPFPGSDPGARTQINRAVFKKGSHTRIALYWFHTPARIVADPSMSKIHRFARLLRGHLSTSVVKVEIGVSVDRSVEETMACTKPFLHLVVQRLAEHLGPDWTVPILTQ